MTEVRAAPVDWSRVNWATVDVRQLNYANMPPEARAALARRIGEIRNTPTARRSRSGTPLPAAAGRDPGEHNRIVQIATNVIAGRRVLNEDGIAGRYTRAAIRDLQRDLLNERRGDGFSGMRTYDAVARALVTPPPRPPRIARVEPDRPAARNLAQPSALTHAEVAPPVEPRVIEPGPAERVLPAPGEARAPVEVTARDLAARLADRPRASEAVQELGDLATEGGRESPHYGPTLDAIATELRGRPDALADTLANVGAHSPQLLRELTERLHPGDEGARDAAVIAAHARAATRVPEGERPELARGAAERIAELHEDRAAFDRALPQLRERFANDPSALGALLRHGGLPEDMARDLVAGTWTGMPRGAQEATAQWLIGADPTSIPEAMRAMVRQRAEYSSGRAETADEVFALMAPGAGLGIGALRAGMARLLATRALPEAGGAMGRYVMTGAGRREMPRIVAAGRERLSALERAQYMEIQRGIARLMETNRDLAFQFRNQLNTWMRVNNRML